MNIIKLLELKTTKLSASKTVVELDVTENIMQPYGIVHGGINALLAETAASLGAKEILPDDQFPVGVDIHTHHLKAVSKGHLIATATPVNIGRSLQVWAVNITESMSNQLTSIATVTLKNQSKTKKS
ncbi:PaaI family thioesterase [Leuconostoc litchii]|uniref:PaaI family thioesterase n=1 Tax=Leuconostoc litchii TaxID=1981069 RepID=A0A652NDZ9_9LACO|nr:PaaI family thioesterase [Leuconostoc litchii]TYC46152.1 PaaI family thioesterase [Leuconostoc litchii]